MLVDTPTRIINESNDFIGGRRLRSFKFKNTIAGSVNLINKSGD
jgi:hypothetical protein